MGKYINHHVVPKSYLKRFSVRGDGKRKSHYINVKTNKTSVPLIISGNSVILYNCQEGEMG